jgi:hypothetical protein
MNAPTCRPSVNRLLLIAALALSIHVARGAELGAATVLPKNLASGFRVVLENTRPLAFPRGTRLPLYLWPAMNPGRLTPAEASALVRELDRRGVAVVCSWDWGRRDASLEEALVVARAQRDAGLLVNVEATSLLSSFFDGDTRTAHVDDAGKTFWDTSFGRPDMGCPFALEHRCPAIRERAEWFASACRRASIEPGFVFADWEIDGPIEWNGAWAASQRCTRCRKAVPDLANFLSFQKAVRDLRSDLQADTFAGPLRRAFPGIRVGNYAVYPNDGFRRWYDYFEKEAPSAPGIQDHGARYRHWAAEFESSGYTMAMPVVYTWERLFGWYDFASTDYRWFYNMLQEAGTAGRHAPAAVPVVSFVHWHTTAPSDPPVAGVKPMSEWAYQELLWHMLLRGTDAFYLWCMPAEQPKEVGLVHSVWAAAQEFGRFLDQGRPVSFDVPAAAGPVVSGLVLGDQVLVRRTDFAPGADEPVTVRVDGKTLRVGASAGRCQVLDLK